MSNWLVPLSAFSHPQWGNLDLSIHDDKAAPTTKHTYTWLCQGACALSILMLRVIAISPDEILIYTAILPIVPQCWKMAPAMKPLPPNKGPFPNPYLKWEWNVSQLSQSSAKGNVPPWTWSGPLVQSLTFFSQSPLIENKIKDSLDMLLQGCGHSIIGRSNSDSATKCPKPHQDFYPLAQFIQLTFKTCNQSNPQSLNGPRIFPKSHAQATCWNNILIPYVQSIPIKFFNFPTQIIKFPPQTNQNVPNHMLKQDDD